MSGKLFHPGIIKSVRLYFLFLFLFFVFRLCFLGINYSASATELSSLLPGLFLTGLQFDSCISSYLLMIPALLLFVSGFLKRGRYLFNRIIIFYLTAIGAVALFICAADIPYYHQFHSRITIAALSWMDNPLFVFKMVFGYAYNYIFLSVFILASITFIFFVRRILSERNIQNAPVFNYKYALSYLLLFGLLVIGARGRLQRKSTINWGVAYFSVNPFANMAALNPVFTFATSFK